MENGGMIEQEKSSHITIIFGIIALIIIGAIYFIYGRTDNKPITTVTNNLEEAKKALLASSTFQTSPNSPLKIIESDALPEDVRLLVNTDAKLLLVQEATSENGKNIYHISFVVDMPLASYYQKINTLIRGSKKWTVTRSTRANMFAVIEAENTTYRVQIRGTRTSDTVTDVSIDAQSK